VAPGCSSQGSQKPVNGLYLESDDPGHIIQLQFLTQTLISHLRKFYTKDRRPVLLKPWNKFTIKIQHFEGTCWLHIHGGLLDHPENENIQPLRNVDNRIPIYTALYPRLNLSLAPPWNSIM